MRIRDHILHGFNPASDSTVPDPGEQALLEEGLPLPEAKHATVLPPGGGKAILPHYQTFSMLVNSMSRTYRWSYDEALRHSQQNALAIRRDPVVMHCLRARQIPTVQLPWHLEYFDDQDEAANDAIKDLTDCIKSIPNLQQMLMHSQEALWFGRYGTQLIPEWDWSTGKKKLGIRAYKPVNGDKLIFRWSGEVGILVHATYKGSWQVTDRGRAHFLTPEEREQLILHRFEPEDADFWEGDIAGGINGIGIRSRIYWLWYLKQQVFSFLMDYLERVGAGGFTVYYYEMGNPESLEQVKVAAESQWRNNAILFPRYRDAKNSGPGVENIAVSTGGASLLQALVTDYFDNLIRQYILGQSLTSQQASGGGLGDGVAGLHEDTFARLIKYDAVNLAETLTTDLVRVLQKYNAPKVRKPIRWVFEIDKPNAAEVLEASSAFFEMGGTLDEDELRGTIGLSKPTPGGSMLAKFQSMEPAAMGAGGQMPQGVPMLGQPGPEAGMGGPPGPPGDMGGAGQPPVQMAKKGKKRKYAAVRDYLPTLAKLYNGKHLHRQNTLPTAPDYHLVTIQNGSREIGIHVDPRQENVAHVDFDFTQQPKDLSPKNTNMDVGKDIQPGSLAFVKHLTGIIKHLGDQGFGVSYVPASERHGKAYQNILSKLGFARDTNKSSNRGVLGYHVWNPPKKTQVESPLQLARTTSRRAKLARPGSNMSKK